MYNKIIIFGNNGMLGRYITKYFSIKTKYKIIPVGRADFEINSANISNLDMFLISLDIDNNTCIINCTGLIPQRMKNTDSDEYFIVNTVFPQHLSRICNKYGAKLICPTTDCVFSGKKGNYIETDFHDEDNAYGISKSLGEPVDATVIRTSIIGEELKNKYSFLEFVKNSNGTINGWNTHYWNGITCYQYCKIIEQIIQQNLFWKGVRHIYSPSAKSKYELACIIKNAYHLNLFINKYDTYPPCDKTLKSIYETNNLFHIPPLEDQIYEMASFVL